MKVLEEVLFLFSTYFSLFYILHLKLALHRHQEMDCSKRSVKCQFKWCNLVCVNTLAYHIAMYPVLYLYRVGLIFAFFIQSFPMDQLRDHEDLCGRKKVPCPVCKEVN